MSDERTDRGPSGSGTHGERPLGYRAATFDCYGTLVDWEGGAGSFLYQLAMARGEAMPPPARELRDRWERIQFEMVVGPYRPYVEVLRLSLARWCEERGYAVGPGDGEALAAAMRSWGPFPDTRPALIAAREAGLRLVIVSNSDHSLMDHTVRQIGVPFDDVVLAEDAGAYKPSEAPFRLALERIGEPPERVLHVAFGFEYDIGPAQRLGMATAWVNRHAAAPPTMPAGGPDRPPRPDFEWRDLWGLARLVGGAAADEG